jgi:hypothetical protein
MDFFHSSKGNIQSGKNVNAFPGIKRSFLSKTVFQRPRLKLRASKVAFILHGG